MIPPLQAVLDFLAAQLAPADFLPPSPFEAYVPTARDLDSTIADSVLATYRAAVGARWQVAVAAGLVARVDQAKTVAGLMASPPARQPVLGLEDARPRRFEFRLDLNLAAGAERNELGRTLAANPSAAPPVRLADKVEAVVQLRRVEDVLIRLLAARQAASATGVPLAEVLALYRTEGNLDVPVGFYSLIGRVPSDSPRAVSRVVHFPLHSDSPPPPAKPVFMFPHLVWLARPSGEYHGVPLTYPAATPAAAFTAKEPALVDWMLHLCGLDQVQGLYLGASLNGRPARDAFAIWSDRNWNAAGVASTPGAAAARWSKLVDNLEIWPAKAGAPAAYSVTPKVPEDFVAGILAEGLMLLRSRRTTDSFRYLVYHAGNDQASALALRGMMAARGTTVARYRPLRDAIAADPAFVGVLASLERSVLKETNTERAVALLLPAVGDFGRWLSQDIPVRGVLVADFLETATAGPTGVWPTWTEHRGNLLRYLDLVDYYRRLFP